jgi:hypothetical protein
VFPLGHLVVQGVKEITHKIECTVFETATWFCTPSWFVVVVDLARPQKPVWLVRDPYNLGWSTASDSDSDSKHPNDRISGLTNASHKRRENDAGELIEPERVDYIKKNPQKFFQRLHAHNIDLIKLFPSLDEWCRHDIDTKTIRDYLFSPSNRFHA